jgi:hypothetical protein
VLFLEDRYNLKEAKERVITLDEVDISHIGEIETTHSSLKEFLD